MNRLSIGFVLFFMTIFAGDSPDETLAGIGNGIGGIAH
jgi:hypothetical protein